MKYVPIRVKNCVDAVQLSYPMVIIIPPNMYEEGGEDRGYRGDWLVTHPEGGQYFLPDSVFKSRYEKVE